MPFSSSLGVDPSPLTMRERDGETASISSACIFNVFSRIWGEESESHGLFLLRLARSLFFSLSSRCLSYSYASVVQNAPKIIITRSTWHNHDRWIIMQTLGVTWYRVTQRSAFEVLSINKGPIFTSQKKITNCRKKMRFDESQVWLLDFSLPGNERTKVEH